MAWQINNLPHNLTPLFSRKIIMLVLSRKENESIVIEGHIKVTVVEIRGDKIRLGIEAPRDVAVWREELERRARNERRELAKV
jgi:carbon storage regulator